jgi:hypothetical protein
MAKTLGLGEARGSGGLAIEAPRQPCRVGEVWGHAAFGPSRGRGLSLTSTHPRGGRADFSVRPSKAAARATVSVTAIHS